MLVPSMRSLVIKKYLGPAFIAFEAIMHVYILAYLTLNWTNLLIWAFTAFELTMFIYLFLTGRNKKEHKRKRKPSVGERHMRHYQYCGCLGDSGTCCNPECDCEE